MDRRDFIKTTGALVAGATLAPGALAEGPAEEIQNQETATSGRTTLPMNRGWLYSRTAEQAATARTFNDASFDRVVIPHTNIKLPWHGFTEQDYTFVSTYRRHFKLPEAAMGKRVFVDFEGVMTASTVYLNGQKLGEYKGGYTPFSFELTERPSRTRPATMCSPWRWIPLSVRTFRPSATKSTTLPSAASTARSPCASCRETFSTTSSPRQKRLAKPAVEVKCYLGVPILAERLVTGTTRSPRKCWTATVSSAKPPARVPPPVWRKASWNTPSKFPSSKRSICGISTIRSSIMCACACCAAAMSSTSKLAASASVRRPSPITASRSTEKSSSCAASIVIKPFPMLAGPCPGACSAAMPTSCASYHCNLVRTSHYPQSRHFLDRCDEIGLLVLEEIPGWQHIGDKAWQDIAVDNVGRMIRRDWNHPSIVLWGVRINESRDNHDFYTRTNALAHELDTTRQTGGIRYFQESEFLEDVFTMNDFGWPLKKPNHPRYLNTEFVGHTYPCKTFDSMERLREHTIRHARVHDALASDPQYAGGIGWCAFDYNTHANFGSGDRICYHGVADIFREPKPAAFFYKSQCDPSEQIVLEPAFHWARNDESIGFTKGLICSNCDHVKIYTITSSGEHLLAEADPDRTQFPHLKYAPFDVDFGEKIRENWGDLRIDGYINGKQVISRRYSGDGVDHEFVVTPDDTELIADGADTTRIVLRMNDAYGAIRPFSSDGIALELEGPATLIGDNPATLIGGAVAVWIRANEQPGTVTLRAKHPRHGTKEVSITLKQTEPEQV